MIISRNIISRISFIFRRKFYKQIDHLKYYLGCTIDFVETFTLSFRVTFGNLFIYFEHRRERERERDPTTFSCRLFKIKLNHNSKNKPSKLFRLNFDSPPFFFFFFSINFFNNLVKFNQHPLYRRDKKDEERGTAFIPVEILARTFIVLNSLARRFVSPPRTSSDA